MISSDPICAIQGLRVTFPTRRSGVIKAVDDIWLEIMPGEAIGIVGESGSGKSVMALSLLGLVPPPGRCEGRVLVAGQNVLALRGRELTRIRGRRIGLILQDPTPALNPIRTIESQLREAARLAGIPAADQSRRLQSGIREVKLDPAAVLRKYPFELSGGMNQRIAIAMALLQQPDLLVADEPTTALDVTTQAHILALLDSVRRKRGMALVLISHDIGVVYQVSNRIGVMYGGRLVEVGDTETIVHRPAHPYTQALINAVPSLDRPGQSVRGIPGHLSHIRVDDRGCPFEPRCAYALPACRDNFPGPTHLGPKHTSWCWWLQSLDRESSARDESAIT